MLKLLARLLLRLVYRVEVTGEFAPHRRTLIIANHQSFLDALLVYAFLPVDTWWLAHSTIARRPFFRLLLRAVDYVIADTSSPFSIKILLNLVEQGKPAVIFPEGRITATGQIMKLYEGPAFVAAKTGAAVVPIRIDGAVHARFFSRMSGDFPLRLFPRIRLRIFPAVEIPMPGAPTGKLRRRIAGEQMRRMMQQQEVDCRPRNTLFAALLDAAALHGRNRDILEDSTGKVYTYRTLIKAAFALGRVAAKLTREGETAGILLPNVGTTPCLLFGLWAMRRVPAMINYTAGPDGVRSALRAARARVLFTSRAFIEKARLQPLIDKIGVERIVYLEDVRAMLTLGDKLWLTLYATRFPRRAMRPARESDPALVIFTSGSEDKPKGAVSTHGAIRAMVAIILAALDLNSKDKLMNCMPLFHSFGMIGLLTPLLTGMRVFLYISPLHYRLVPEMTYDRDCTVIFATNTFLANYARRAHPYDFRSLRLAVCGAEKLTTEVRVTYAERFGVRVLEAYGATECNTLVTANTPLANRPGTVGQPGPGIDCRIEPVPGIPEGGILHTRGPNLMSGYWKEDRPGELQWPPSVFGPDWYNTGDIAAIDDDGFIRIIGRMKRFAKVAGEMVSLEVVENIALAAAPNAIHGAVTLPDAMRGELIVLATTDKTLTRPQLQQAARALGAPDLAIPRRIVSIEKIPLLATGKKDYVKLRALIEGLP